MYLVVFASRKAKNLPLLFQNEGHVREMRSFNRGPLPPSVYLHVQPVDRQNIISVIKWTRPPPPFLHTASNQKLDGGKAL